MRKKTIFSRRGVLMENMFGGACGPRGLWRWVASDFMEKVLLPLRAPRCVRRGCFRGGSRGGGRRAAAAGSCRATAAAAVRRTAPRARPPTPCRRRSRRCRRLGRPRRRLRQRRRRLRCCGTPGRTCRARGGCTAPPPAATIERRIATIVSEKGGAGRLGPRPPDRPPQRVREARLAVSR